MTIQPIPAQFDSPYPAIPRSTCLPAPGLFFSFSTLLTTLRPFDIPSPSDSIRQTCPYRACTTTLPGPFPFDKPAPPVLSTTTSRLSPCSTFTTHTAKPIPVRHTASLSARSTDRPPLTQFDKLDHSDLSRRANQPSASSTIHSRPSSSTCQPRLRLPSSTIHSTPLLPNQPHSTGRTTPAQTPWND